MEQASDYKQQYKMIRRSAMDLLMRREHSKQQLSIKLQAKYSESKVIIAEVIAQLQQENLQSDHRFTEAFCRYRINKGQGPIKIGYDLRQTGVADDLIADTLNEYSDQYHDIALSALHKKFISAEDTPAIKAKALRFLSQRGFNQEIAYAAWDTLHRHQ